MLDIDYASRLRTVTRDEYLARYPQLRQQIEALDFHIGIDSKGAEQPTASWVAPAIEGLVKGRDIAHYRLVRKVGEGAMGQVWQAHDLRLDRTVALKLPNAIDMSPDVRQRFLREGQAASQLRHPNLVTVHAVGRDGPYAYIATEFIEGGDLGRELKAGPLPVKRVVELAAALAEALHHAHQHGVVHRDLKPANILLDLDGVPRITDFGLAKWERDASALTAHGQLLGTPAYMAPEQALGKTSEIDCRTDVYGLGAILYEALTGQPPHSGDRAAVLLSVIHIDPPMPRRLRRSVPRDLDTICRKALQKRPEGRYATSQELAVDLRRFQRGEMILARRANPLRRLLQTVQRRPAAAVVVLLATLLAVTALAFRELQLQNRELRGAREVAILTAPPGAQVAFVPIEETTGRLLVEEMSSKPIEAPGNARLTPGDYLVAARWNDGRFHEVFRRVPAKSVDAPGQFRHTRWLIRENNVIELPPIEAPPNQVVEGMLRVPTESDGPVDDFILVDPYPTTFAQALALRQGRPFGDPRSHGAPNSPATVSYDQAVELAERAGKRLPTEREWELISRRSKSNEGAHSSGIKGLFAGLAEWTTTPAGAATGTRTLTNSVASLSDTRIARGADRDRLDSGIEPDEPSRNAMASVVLWRHEVRPRLVFRCVRSSRPRLDTDDFRFLTEQ
ncbi:bifunctional serine/threonine-protein kinase/formylglycine-generating enzyme family protein [Botrimarina mediterranea]|uniref:bifunctional serine/threonine-protein kinase/formylglycine-generating enzyme family protein n=1 Tax=Botrimarina mediterranea TaxID=2528022 RepID=UPI0018D3FB67|nr:serine/threonine-protein kinase [Botrimarina mediterranea]